MGPPQAGFGVYTQAGEVPEKALATPPPTPSSTALARPLVRRVTAVMILLCNWHLTPLPHFLEAHSYQLHTPLRLAFSPALCSRIASPSAFREGGPTVSALFLSPHECSRQITA